MNENSCFLWMTHHVADKWNKIADKYYDPIIHNNLENLNGYKITLCRSAPQLVITASVILLRRITTSFAEANNTTWVCGLCVHFLRVI